MKNEMERRAIRLNEILERRGEALQVRVHEKVRPNGIDFGYVLEGENKVCSPVVYYDPEWWGLGDEEAADFLLERERESGVKGEIPGLSGVLQREGILSLVKPKLLGSSNLENMREHGYVYREIRKLRLIAGFYLDLSNGRNIPVKNVLIEKEKITVEELCQAALYNLRKETIVMPLSGFLNELKAGFTEKFTVAENGDIPIFILTNQSKTYGAAAMLERDVLEEIAAERGDLYLLPSSVHEVLLIPEKFGDPDLLRKIMKDMNARWNYEEEILSDEVFHWKNGELSV